MKRILKWKSLPISISEEEYGMSRYCSTRWKILGAVLSVVLIISLSRSDQKEPNIEFEQRVYDFGEIDQGEQIVHLFKFKNAGDTLLEIKRVSTSCGCTAALVSKKRIPPGDSGEIKATFNSKGYAGQISKWIYVHSNDPDEPKIKLNLKGRVIIDLLVQPSSVNFGKVPNGKMSTEEVILVPIRLRTLEVKKVECSSPYIAHTVSEYTKGNQKGFKIEVTVGAEMPVGNFSEVIKVHTNSERQPIVTIPIRGKVLGEVWATPEEIAFGCRRGNVDTLMLTIHKDTLQNFRIVKATQNFDYIKTVVEFVAEDSTTQNYRVIFSIDEDAPKGFIEGNLELWASGKDEPISRLSMYIFIQ